MRISALRSGPAGLDDPVRGRPVPGAARKGRHRSAPRRARLVSAQRSAARRLRRVGCFEQDHDENAETKTNQQRKTDDEDVRHTRSLRFDTVLLVWPRGLQRRERRRDVKCDLSMCARRRLRAIARRHASHAFEDARPSRAIRHAAAVDAGATRDARSVRAKSADATAHARVVASAPVGRGIPGAKEEEIPRCMRRPPAPVAERTIPAS